MTFDRVCDLFRAERLRFVLAGYALEAVKLRIDPRPPPNYRALAYSTRRSLLDNLGRSGGEVTLYEAATTYPRASLVAIFRHELAHLALFHKAHSEREADRLAELVGGQAIYYDAGDVQTVAGGTRPRPARLGF